MKYLLIYLFFFVSCGNLERKNIIIYFDNGNIDDKPSSFPNFAMLESKYSDLIYRLDEVFAKKEKFEIIINRIRRDRHIDEGSLKQEDIDMEKAIYIIDGRDTLFFNASNRFYTTHNNFVFQDEDLANDIKNLIDYDRTLKKGVGQDRPSPLYYKVLIRAE